MCLARLLYVRVILYDLNREGFPQLKHLHIQDSDELKYIIHSMGKAHPYPAFRNLETLALQNLVNVEEICHGPIPIQSFAKLKEIKVKGCDKLKNLFWYSLVGHLHQLLKIEIFECKLMTAIIAEQTSEAEKDIDKVMFPKLHSLTLECLPSLISFCSASSLAVDMSCINCAKKYDDTQSVHTALIDQKVGMPHLQTLKLSKINSCKLWADKISDNSCIKNLTSLTIDECGSIQYIFSLLVARELLNLQYLAISNCQMLEEIFVLDGKLSDLPSAQKPLFNEVIFPNLETLVISHMDHLKSVCHNQLAPNSFCKLKKLEIEFCDKLLTIIPSYMLNNLLKLETMIVTNCPMLEVVFEIDVGSEEGLEMQLKTLTLQHLPMLKHIWSRNTCGFLKSQNLCQVDVVECKSLNHVFPLSVAKELPHLQNLWIENCSIENIVAQDELSNTDLIFAFPELKSLHFRSLTKLRSFYQGLHTLNCPILTELDVYHCDQLELFMPNSLNYGEIVPIVPQPLLSIEKVICNLRELTLSSKDVTMLCNGLLYEEHIYRVKSLRIRCFHDESEKFPLGILQRFINLENLKVTCSSFTEIFSTGSFSSGHSETTMKLRSLILVELQNLKSICEDKSQMQAVLQNLESLIVFECSRLKNIAPSSMLLQNLKELYVNNCVGLENIITASSATSLAKLQKLCIRNCEKIEEIVASNNDSDACELALMKLEHLQLEKLPKLRGFCKGSYNFKFPLLRKLFVIECPMMETFSYGMLSTPKLRRVYVNSQNEWHWNGDLNTTIRTNFSKMNSKEN